MHETSVRSIASCVFTPANQPAPSTRTRATARAHRLGRDRRGASGGMLARSCAAALLSLVINETSTPIRKGGTERRHRRAEATAPRAPSVDVRHCRGVSLQRAILHVRVVLVIENLCDHLRDVLAIRTL